MQNPLKNGSDDGPEDALMADANVDVNLGSILEAWEQCRFNLDFPKLDHARAWQNAFPAVRPRRLRVNPF